MGIIIVLISFALLIDVVDYFNVNVGDVFVDDIGNQFAVVEKNPFLAKIVNERESKIVPLIWLCSKCCKIN